MSEICCGSGFLWLILSFLTFAVNSEEEVYFDKYGHCIRDSPFELHDDTYRAYSIGGGLKHETLKCQLSFKAPRHYGVCLKFKEFYIDHCDTEILVYDDEGTTGSVWRRFTCESETPTKVCTNKRFLTIQVSKTGLNSNKGYYFEIDVEKSDNITDKGVLFVSIGVFVVIILVVVFFITVSAIVVVYCCCKWKTRKQDKDRNSRSADEHMAQPSAPPAEEIPMIEHNEHGIYPRLPVAGTCPPAYEPPPPYSENTSAGNVEETALKITTPSSPSPPTSPSHQPAPASTVSQTSPHNSPDTKHSAP